MEQKGIQNYIELTDIIVAFKFDSICCYVLYQ